MWTLCKVAAFLFIMLVLQTCAVRVQGRNGGPEQFLFDSANRERAARGLRTLKWDATLAAAARQHALRMARENALSHQFPGEPEPAARAQQAGARFDVFAENVAYGPTAEEIHEGWMKSPPHRQNLLDPRLDSIGIAVTERGQQLFAAQDFSRVVATLSVEEQEGRVRAQLKAQGLRLLNENAEARRACELGPGHEAGQRPEFAVRYSSADLNGLPEALKKALRRGQYHIAAVGACAPPRAGSFTEYQLAVLLYE